MTTAIRRFRSGGDGGRGRGDLARGKFRLEPPSHIRAAALIGGENETRGCNVTGADGAFPRRAFGAERAVVPPEFR